MTCLANKNLTRLLFKKVVLQGFFNKNKNNPPLSQRDDGTYTPCSLSICATLDAWRYAPYCATLNTRGAIFLGSLTSGACRLALRRLSGAGNNPQAKYDRRCCSCYRRGKQVILDL